MMTDQQLLAALNSIHDRLVRLSRDYTDGQGFHLANTAREDLDAVRECVRERIGWSEDAEESTRPALSREGWRLVVEAMAAGLRGEEYNGADLQTGDTSKAEINATEGER